MFEGWKRILGWVWARAWSNLYLESTLGSLYGGCSGETGFHRKVVQEGPSGSEVSPPVGGKGSDVRRGLLEGCSETESGRVGFKEGRCVQSLGKGWVPSQ